MPPKKPIVIKLKNVKPVDTEAIANECWAKVKDCAEAVFDVAEQAAPATVLQSSGAVSAESGELPSLAALASAAAAADATGDEARAIQQAAGANGTRRRELLLHRRVSRLGFALHTVYRAAEDMCRMQPGPMLARVREVLERRVPRGVDAWLRAVSAALEAIIARGATAAPANEDDVAEASATQQQQQQPVSPSDAQACMRLVVAAWEYQRAALGVVREFASTLNAFARSNAPEGDLLRIGTLQFWRALSSGHGTLFKTACRGFIDAVNADRQGDSVRRSDLTSCRDLLMETSAYYTHVEAPLAAAADKFYTRLGNMMVYSERVDAAQYVARVTAEIAAEDQRLRAFSTEQSRVTIQKALQERLIKAHIGAICSTHMKALVTSRDFATLGALFRLSRRPHVRAEDALRKAFKEYVAKATQEIIAMDASMEDTIVDLLIALNSTATAVIERSFVVGTLGTDAFSTAKKDAFEAALRPKQQRAAELLARHLDTILREGVKALEGKAGAAAGLPETASASPAAEDGTSAGVTAAEQTDAALLEAMKIFSFIPSKDVFEAIYTRHFGKRLILQRTVGIEHERVVIEQLRLVCGPSVAMKLNGMLKDLDLSRDIQQLYQQTRFVRLGATANGDSAATTANEDDANALPRSDTMGEPTLSGIGPAQSALAAAEVDPRASLPRDNGTTNTADGEDAPKDAASSAAATTIALQPCGFDFNVLVLTEGYWPTYAAVQPRVPDSISRQMELFRVFYHSKYSGRRLNWQHALSHCVVRATLRKGQRKELVVSFLQAMILTLFNDADSLTYGDVLERLNVEQSEEMTCAVIALYAGNAKLLVREKAEGLPALPPPKNGEPRVVVRNEDTLRYNAEFRHRLVKIRVNQVQLKETKEEVQETTEKVLAERHFIVDAAIVRFMKSRKQAKHNDLVAEVLGMLRFEAQPQGIKKRIEHLIEREYLERDDADPSLYRYLA